MFENAQLQINIQKQYVYVKYMNTLYQYYFLTDLQTNLTRKYQAHEFTRLYYDENK